MKNKTKRVDFLISFVTAVVVSIVYFLLLRHFLPTPILLNDQILFREIASGHYTGTPSGETIHIMYIYGKMLALLYRFVTSVQWYDLLAYAVMPVGAFFFALFISLETKNRFFKVAWPCLFGAAFYLCTATFYVQNEYTVNAGILAAVGLLYFSSNLVKKKTGLYNFIGIILIITSLLLRVHIFVMVLPLMFLILVKGLIKGENREGFLKFVAIFIAGIIVCYSVETIMHRSAQWQEFRTYNDARISIFDYEGLPDDEETIAACAEIGITAIEYKGLQQEFGLVKSVDATELSKVAEITGLSFTERLKTTNYKFVLSTWIQKMKDFIKQPIGLMAFALLGLIFLLELINNKEKFFKRFANLFWGLLGVGYLCAFSGYFVFIGRFPARVYVSLGYMLAAYYSALAIEETTRIKEEKRKPAFIIQAAIIVVLLCISGMMFKRNTNLAVSNWFWRQEYMEVSNEIRELCNSNPEKLFYISKRIAPSQAAYLNDADYKIPDNFLTEVYWTHNSPVHSERLANMGITNTIDAIMTRNDMYYVAYSDDDLNWLTELTGFYGHAVTFSLESSFESQKGTINIYHIEN